jgi:hypothetical protein
MQMLLAHSAFWRAMVVFAGTLMGKIAADARTSKDAGHGGLVCWSPGARSRREDELARTERSEVK